MGKHRADRTSSRRRSQKIIAGVLCAGLAGGILTTTYSLFAAEHAVYAVADTTATSVPQDGDNSRKTTLATCPSLCERNKRGAREAVIEFAVNSLPANATDVRARLEVYSWTDFRATITAHVSSNNARAARPDLEVPGPVLDTIRRVARGYNAFDVSKLVTGNGSYTIALRQHYLDSRIYWASLENRNKSIRPRLVLTYRVRGKAATPAPNPTTAAPSASPTASQSVAPSASPSAAPSSRPAAPSPSSTCGHVLPKLVPSCGAWWGIYSPASKAQGWDHGAAVRDVEKKVGRKFDIVHRYHDFSNQGSNGVFPDRYEREQMAEGRLMFFAWESRVFSTGEVLKWRDVYSGKYDKVIDDVARRIAALDVPVFMGFDHEPEDDPEKGSDADFVRAWRYVHDRFARAGAHNAVWVWTVMGWSGHYHRYADLYPGDKYVDWVAYDPYNFYHCNGSKTWKSPETTIGTFYRWLDASGIGAGKPRMLAEFGTNFDPNDPLAKKRWFEDFPAAVKKHPKIKAVIYFNSAGATTTSANCDMTLGPNESALAGFRTAGQDPYFRQPINLEELKKIK